jgi:hypothetical protein
MFEGDFADMCIEKTPLVQLECCTDMRASADGFDSIVQGKKDRFTSPENKFELIS